MYPSPPTSPACPSLETQGHGGTAPALPAIETLALPTPNTSPPQCSSIPASNVEERIEHQNRATVMALKSYLSLTEWRCGSTTQQNKPCKIKIGKVVQEQIDSHIESMVALTRSSPGLKSELTQLVRLVHCRHHDVGRPVDVRVEAWIDNFFKEVEETEPVISTEKRIRKALPELSTFCSRTTGTNSWCTEKIGGQQVANCAKTIDKIIKPEVHLHDAQLQYFLEVLAANTVCQLHCNSQRYLKVALWKSAIIEIRAEIGQESVQSVEQSPQDKLEDRTQDPNVQDIEKQSSEKRASLLVDQSLPTPTSPRLATPNPAAYWPKAYDITPFDNVRRDKLLTESNSTYSLVKRTMLRPLSTVDHKVAMFTYLRLKEIKDMSK